MSLPPRSTFIALPGGQFGFVIEGRVVRLASGSCRVVTGAWKPAKPVEFDLEVGDARAVQHLATLRLAELAASTTSVPASVWREAVGGASVLAAYNAMKGRSAAEMLAAFGIAHPCLVPVEWALQLPQEDTMAHVRAKAQQCGIGPVLAALEVVDLMGVYAALAHEEGVETCRGLAWR